MFKKISLFIGAIVMSSSLLAQNAPQAPVQEASSQNLSSDWTLKDKLWVTSGFFSKHLTTDFAPRQGYNESNSGLGLEYVVNDNWRIVGGYYKNSVYKDTRYLQAVWTPDLTTKRFEDGRLAFGIAFGVLDGYPTLNKGKIAPALLPVISMEYKRVGVNLTYIPTISGNVDGALAIQVKFQFY